MNAYIVEFLEIDCKNASQFMSHRLQTFTSLRKALNVFNDLSIALSPTIERESAKTYQNIYKRDDGDRIVIRVKYDSYLGELSLNETVLNNEEL